MKTTSATRLADSITPNGVRLTTYLIIYPRYLLNFFSSLKSFYVSSLNLDKIPTKQILTDIIQNPFTPQEWKQDSSNMKKRILIEKSKKRQFCIDNWQAAKIAAIKNATVAEEFNSIHRQVANRMIEPYMWDISIITGINFPELFKLTIDPSIDVHLTELLTKMFIEYKYNPRLLKPGEWHIPFKDNIDITEINTLNLIQKAMASLMHKSICKDVLKISTAMIYDTLLLKSTFDYNYIHLISNYNKFLLGLNPDILMHSAQYLNKPIVDSNIKRKLKKDNVLTNYPNTYEEFLPYLYTL